jgi:hypothetical protein
VRWREEVANVRLHAATKQRPVDRFPAERERLRTLPSPSFNPDELVSVIVSSHARVYFDGNRYSVPPEFIGQLLLLRANEREVRVLRSDAEVARHARCYDRGQLLVQPDHQLAALAQRSRLRARDLEATFDSLGGAARQFHLELRRRPVKTHVHLRKVLRLVELYGRGEVLAALARAAEYRTFDAAYVETLVLQERRRRELPSPVPLRPKRPELLEETAFDEPDPAFYDRLYSQEAAATDVTDTTPVEPTHSSPHSLPSDPPATAAPAAALPASPNEEPDHA